MPTDTGLIPTLRHTHSPGDAPPNSSKEKCAHGGPFLDRKALQEWDSLFPNTHYCTVFSVRALQLVSSPFKAAVSDHDYCLPTPIEDSTATPYNNKGLVRPTYHPTTMRIHCHRTQQLSFRERKYAPTGRQNAAEKPTRPQPWGTASKGSGLHH